ncbi:hypothetical protein EI42_03746 [Thermosporothrix hazakensis]|jgi:hypothetical protein|uniref:Uncharacterized protein n=2 Tax=Thermosporothrix TaxID=768650 RepID=A0A326U559_THEHA|nr:hypothetical protein [Thermosporothrix hazakensis]PZW26594.1 hypothetical protein EI42_03746 [Thermosporothrix hazakensis]BBH89523.1 hypothetical protein KTC_42740 [Thermosporothrix sp. COM3]GCE47705.1 hypothetical protein KTH_25740 [Thermosporothrix hazakensis]
MFNKTSYRRGIIEGVILYTLGRLGSLISPVVFPGWLFLILPLIFLVLQYVIAPVWATRRIASTKRERLSKRFWLLGPRMALICFGIDLVLSLCVGLPTGPFGVQLGPGIMRLMSHGKEALTWLDFAGTEVRSLVTLLAFYVMAVVCSRLAMGGFLRFTMPAGGNRVTL